MAKRTVKAATQRTKVTAKENQDTKASRPVILTQEQESEISDYLLQNLDDPQRLAFMYLLREIEKAKGVFVAWNCTKHTQGDAHIQASDSLMRIERISRLTWDFYKMLKPDGADANMSQ